MTGVTRPAAETEAMTDVELAARLRMTLGRLSRRVRQYGPRTLTSSQASTLSSLEALGPVRLGDLAAHEGVSAPTQSRLVASLETQALLRRTPDVGDRRATLLEITPEGRRQLEQLRTERSAFLVERLGTLSPEQRAALVGALDVLESLAASPGD
ncbi:MULTISPECIES: MarR family winged helix-turn-helix transcriptional regulator [Actinoallomurus]|uniref:MarR family winged helix-turn-helix transcriptional regulator n=1 Tax=Actinoallomurus TaxID=667113 RepID=UPI002091FF5E|nr:MULTISPECIES: MarR family transcriptional regulator [Actinoallomurus]MCO5973652.1 MarR family transcriptional regulator [Actinoallomurus soli]MCO5999396.1 MarR family transcriptional regulator [Actinoallomurus rhizosphaericola]